MNILLNSIANPPLARTWRMCKHAAKIDSRSWEISLPELLWWTAN